MGDTEILLRFIIGFGITLVFGAIAFIREMVDDTGFLTGIILFTVTYVFMDWKGYFIVAVFFIITGIAIEAESKDKAAKGEFELYKAKRPIDKVLGRCLAPALFAALFFVTDKFEFQLAFVASYAASAFDTVSTKFGQLLSKEAVSVMGFKRVHRRTPGGISWQGSIFGILAAVTIAAAAFFIGLLRRWDVLTVIISACIGSYIDSVLNAYSFQKRQIQNEFINFFSSMVGGIAAVLIWWLCNIIFGVKL
jgi:uncharacterized protein (TIGR00297 family)